MHAVRASDLRSAGHRCQGRRFAPKRRFIEADQGDLGCPVPFAKIFLFPSDANHLLSSAIPARTKGRFAIVTDVGQGMRWTQAAPQTRALAADGEVVWS